MKIESVLERASEKLETLLELKNFAKNIGHYELAAKCQEIELEKFPRTTEEIDANNYGEKLNLLFRMVELDIPTPVAFRIEKTLELYKKKKGKFDLKDAAKIIIDSNILFIRTES